MLDGGSRTEAVSVEKEKKKESALVEKTGAGKRFVLWRVDTRAFEVAVLAGLSARSSTCLQVLVREKRVLSRSSAIIPGQPGYCGSKIS